jgi:hypothetical protein
VTLHLVVAALFIGAVLALFVVEASYGGGDPQKGSQRDHL